MSSTITAITFAPDKAALLAQSLAGRVLDTGLGALSKTDLYDFVLYLLDAYSNEHFLFRQSNQENALLLKVTPARVNASKLNIFLKFFDNAAKNPPLREFVRHIVDGTIRLDDAGKNDPGKLQLTIEDAVMRFLINGELKTVAGVAPDIRRNSEIIVLGKKDFFNLLKHIVHTVFDEEERTAYKRRLEKMQANQGLKDALCFVLGFAADTAGAVIPGLSGDVIKSGIQNLFAKISSGSSR